VLLNTRRKMSCLFRVEVFAWPNKHPNPEKEKFLLPSELMFRYTFITKCFYPFHYTAISDGTFHRPQEMRFPAINTHSLLSTSTHFLLKQRYPRSLRKRTTLYNGRENFCIFITFMVHEVRNLILCLTGIMYLFRLPFRTLVCKVETRTPPQPCVTVPSAMYGTCCLWVLRLHDEVYSISRNM